MISYDRDDHGQLYYTDYRGQDEAIRNKDTAVIFSNIEQQSLEFVKYTLEPWLVRWEQSMIRALVSHSEKAAYFIKFNVDGLLRGDYQSRMNGYAIGRQNGWMSANDIRELENLNRTPSSTGRKFRHNSIDAEAPHH